MLIGFGSGGYPMVAAPHANRAGAMTCGRVDRATARRPCKFAASEVLVVDSREHRLDASRARRGTRQFER